MLPQRLAGSQDGPSRRAVVRAPEPFLVAPRPRWREASWLLLGVLLVGLMVALVLVGGPRETSEMRATTPSAGLWLYIAAAAVFGIVLLTAPRRSDRRRFLVVVALLGIAMRVPVWFLPARGGYDYNRYLWDGLVVAHGGTPYRWAPQQILGGEAAGDPVVARLADGRGRAQLDRCNHPRVGSPYPPVAEVLFATAALVSPLRLAGWRALLALFDLLAAALVLRALHRGGVAQALWVAYLWNPLVVVETYFGCHYDLVVGTMMVALALAASMGLAALAAGLVALAFGAKLWPLLLAPVVIRSAWGQWRRLAVALGVLVAMVGAVVLLGWGWSRDSRCENGLARYEASSEDNAGAFRLVAWAAATAVESMPPVSWLTPRTTSAEIHQRATALGDTLARRLRLPVLALAAVWLGLVGPWDTRHVCLRVGAVALLVLLLNHTVYPWYYVAVVPLAAAAARPSLLVWSVLLPLSYLTRQWFNGDALMWLVHLPVWLLLFLELVRWPAWAGAAARRPPDPVHDVFDVR